MEDSLGSASMAYSETSAGGRLAAVTASATASSHAFATGQALQRGGTDGAGVGGYRVFFTIDRPTTVTIRGSLSGSPPGHGGGFLYLICEGVQLVYLLPGQSVDQTFPPTTFRQFASCQAGMGAGAGAGADVGSATASVTGTVTFSSPE